MPIYQYLEHRPQLAMNSYVAPTATLIGQVILEEHANVWFGAVLRGDNECIRVGAYSNIQENCVLHTDMGAPLSIGEHVTIGHGVTLHGCQIGNQSLIGMGAIILNHAVIGDNCIVGAGALVTEGKTFAAGSLIVGSPAKVVRALTDEEIAKLPHNATSYAQRAQSYAQHLQVLTSGTEIPPTGKSSV